MAPDCGSPRWWHSRYPSGGISLDGARWVACRRRRFLLPGRVLSKLFRGLMLDKLLAAHADGKLHFFGSHAALTERKAFAAYLAPLRRRKWHLYAKPPFGGPEAVLAYLSRYTHRVAISNRRLIAFDHNGVTFKYKDYRADGRARYKRMTLAAHEFIRRFLMHVLPKGFHRIRHFGLFAKSSCADNIARVRELLAVPKPQAQHVETDAADREPSRNSLACPCCRGRMVIIETFARGSMPRHRPTATAIRIDTS